MNSWLKHNNKSMLLYIRQNNLAKKKMLKQIVESLQLSTLVISQHIHFVTYNNNKKTSDIGHSSYIVEGFVPRLPRNTPIHSCRKKL
jgi:hypothetical protein